MDCLKQSPVTSCCVTVRNENEIGVQKNTDRCNLVLIVSLLRLVCTVNCFPLYCIIAINIEIGHTCINCIRLGDLGKKLIEARYGHVSVWRGALDVLQTA